MTGHSGNVTTQQLGENRFNRLNQIIEEMARNIVAEKSGKGPFELTVRADGGVIIFSTTVKDSHGEWAWTRNEDLRDELKNYGIVTLQFESSDDGRNFEFLDINLDENVTNAAGAPPAKEDRKPQVAGAAD